MSDTRPPPPIPAPPHSSSNPSHLPCPPPDSSLLYATPPWRRRSWSSQRPRRRASRPLLPRLAPRSLPRRATSWTSRRRLTSSSPKLLVQPCNGWPLPQAPCLPCLDLRWKLDGALREASLEERGSEHTRSSSLPLGDLAAWMNEEVEPFTPQLSSTPSSCWPHRPRMKEVLQARVLAFLVGLWAGTVRPAIQDNEHGRFGWRRLVSTDEHA